MSTISTICFASNQPIGPDERCRMIPIVQQSTYNPVKLIADGKPLEISGIANSNVTSNAYWQPLGGLIPAVYTDLVEVQPVFDTISRLYLMELFEEIYRRSPVVEAGKNQCHDHKFDFPEFIREQAPGIHALLAPRGPFASTLVVKGDALDAEMSKCWEHVYWMAAQHRLFIRAAGGNIRPLQFAAVHEHAYQALVEMTSASTDWDGLSYEQAIFMRRTLELARAAALDTSNREPDDKYNHAATESSFRDAVRTQLGRLSSAENVNRAVETAVHTGLTRQLRSGAITEEQLISAFMPVLNDRYALSAIDSLNLRFTPLATGREDSTNSVGARYARMVSEVSSKISNERNVREDDTPQIAPRRRKP